MQVIRSNFKVLMCNATAKKMVFQQIIIINSTVVYVNHSLHNAFQFCKALEKTLDEYVRLHKYLAINEEHRFLFRKMINI